MYGLIAYFSLTDQFELIYDGGLHGCDPFGLFYGGID
jgi:hypothetical protein